MHSLRDFLGTCIPVECERAASAPGGYQRSVDVNGPYDTAGAIIILGINVNGNASGNIPGNRIDDMNYRWLRVGYRCR
jgi:hypothetical protein